MCVPVTHLWFGWLSSVSPAAPPGPSLPSSSTGSSSRGTAEDQLPSRRTLLLEEETACLLFLEHFREQWWRRWERGTVATADPAKQKRRKRKVDQPRMWRRCRCLMWFMEAGGENSEREAVLGCLGEMDAFKCGVMLLRLMKGGCWWKCSDGGSRRSADGSSAHENRTLDASNADGGVMKQQAASFAHSCFSISTHDGANLCRPGRQRGRGREGQRCGF